MQLPEKRLKIKTIGVLGGMGAAATADFYSHLVAAAQKIYKAQNDDDFPPMWIYNLPIKDFDETGFVDAGSVKKQLLASVKKIESVGCDFIVIPCNTVHYFYTDMQAAIRIPILSIIEATTEAVKKKDHKKVGLLTSQSTRKYQLYEQELAKRGIEIVSALDDEQAVINRIIGRVISGGQGEGNLADLQTIIGRFERNGAGAVILGCTELPLAISQKDCELPLFSSNALLAEAALGYAYGKM